MNRVEQDGLGSKAVRANEYYGIHTLRAVENFPITGIAISHYPDFVRALACVKQACALANRDVGLLDPIKADAIVRACEEIRRGQLHEYFVVDVIQGGAGTSTNMNANEVIANRALEHLGHKRGDYHHLHPIDDVNRSQSTNDVYPTAANVALNFAVGTLLEAMGYLAVAFSKKAQEFRDIMKMGRTQLQDAVPMTVGQEFSAFEMMVQEDRERLAETRGLIREINLGGTAIGTGLNTHPGYRRLAHRHLVDITKMALTAAPNLIEATQDAGAFVQLSGVLKRIGVKLSKICSDLRLLTSGPRLGFGELSLPPVQAGSTIMPGKVNPVIPEVVNQVAFEVVGNDVTVSMAAESGQLQLNAFEPVIIHKLFESLTHLRAGCLTLAQRCIFGVTANTEHLRRSVENAIGLATALVPYIGHELATSIAQEALATGDGVKEVVLRRRALEPDQLDQILQPDRLTTPQPPLNLRLLKPERKL